MSVFNISKNSWYRLMTSSSKQLELSLVGTFPYMSGEKGLVTYGLSNNDIPSQQWQLFSVDSATFMLRTKASGPHGYLGIERLNGSQTTLVPRIYNRTSTDRSFLWRITPAGDGTFHFSNVASGNESRLDFSSYEGARMNTNITKPQRGQAFSFIKVHNIDNTRFSSVDTPPPSLLTASPPSMTPSTTNTSSTSTLERRMSTSAPSITFSTSQSTSFTTYGPSSTGIRSQDLPKNGFSQSASMGIGAAIGVFGLILLSAVGIFLYHYFRKCQQKPESLHYRRAKLWKGFTPLTPQSQFSSRTQQPLKLEDNRRGCNIWVAELPVTPSTTLATPRSVWSPPLSGGRTYSWQSWPEGNGSPLQTPRTGDGMRTPNWPPVELPV